MTYHVYPKASEEVWRRLCGVAWAPISTATSAEAAAIAEFRTEHTEWTGVIFKVGLCQCERGPCEVTHDWFEGRPRALWLVEQEAALVRPTAAITSPVPESPTAMGKPWEPEVVTDSNAISLDDAWARFKSAFSVGSKR